MALVCHHNKLSTARFQVILQAKYQEIASRRARSSSSYDIEASGSSYHAASVPYFCVIGWIVNFLPLCSSCMLGLDLVAVPSFWHLDVPLEKALSYPVKGLAVLLVIRLVAVISPFGASSTVDRHEIVEMERVKFWQLR